MEELDGDNPIDSKAIEEAVKRIDEKLESHPADKTLQKQKSR